MKKEIIIGIFGLALVMLFITSCAMQKVYVCPDGSEVLNVAECKPIEKEEPITKTDRESWIKTETEEPEEEVIEEPEEIVYEINITDEAQALFSKVLTAKTLQYLYVESPNPAENIYSVSREKVKILLKTRVRFTPHDAYDTVYLDLVSETGIAYCENLDRQTCEDRNKLYRVDYETYRTNTPFDWLAMLTKAELTGRSQTLESRLAQEVEFEIKGEPGIMFVESYYSVPVKVIFKGKEYEFRDIVVNEVDDEDLEHQFAD